VPILARDTCLFPETLLDEPPDEPSDRRWWVMYTKPRQEKALARQMLRRQVPFFLPLERKRTLGRGRKFVVHVPLFAGYVFVHGSEEERGVALRTNRISRVLRVPDGERLRRDLLRIHRAIESGEPLTVENRLPPGTRVRVRFGPLMGLEGTVFKRRGETRLLVAVDFLQRGASIQFDELYLEPIGPPRG
jgi:transcriptional antiterminator RfaH